FSPPGLPSQVLLSLFAGRAYCLLGLLPLHSIVSSVRLLTLCKGFRMSQRLKADLSLALCSLFWGATFVVVTGALQHSSTFAFMAARFTVASFLMAPVFWKSLRGLRREELWELGRASCRELGCLLVGGVGVD